MYRYVFAAAGNMEHCHFVSADGDDVDVEDRQYVRGECGVAETCDSHCCARGRGHMHVMLCDPSKCDKDGPTIIDGRRHARAVYTDGTPGNEQVDWAGWLACVWCILDLSNRTFYLLLVFVCIVVQYYCASARPDMSVHSYAT